MDAYIYRAALYCADCAGETRRRLQVLRQDGEPCDDSDCCPQGPYANGGGEADTPQHCDTCGLFLENPLTSDGIEYVHEQLKVHESDDAVRFNTATQWREFYADALAN
jgi:hypothetical protein